MEITDFRIRGEPGDFRDGAGCRLRAETRRGRPPRNRTTLLPSHVCAPIFSRNASKVSVSDGLLWGAAIGATVEGEFDSGRNQLLLRGTYVPAYALNNIFARIPVLGFFLGGSPDEGVFGITYQIAGPVTAPQLTINPLSAVTPGFPAQDVRIRGGNGVQQPLLRDEALR